MHISKIMEHFVLFCARKYIWKDLINGVVSPPIFTAIKEIKMIYIIQKSNDKKQWKLTETESLPITESMHVENFYFYSLFEIADYISKSENNK